MGRTHEATCHIGKDEVTVFPFLPSTAPLPLLLHLVLFEQGNIKFRQVYEAFPCFRFRVSFNVAKGINIINCMKHNEYPSLQINISPSKGKYFPPPHAGDNGS